MRKLLPVLLFCCLPAVASKKPDPADYKDAVLVSFRQVATGQSCTHSGNTKGNIDADTDENGNTTGTISSSSSGTTDCSATGFVYYTLKVGENTYVVHTAPRFLFRPSVLYGHLPGTPIKVRTDKKGLYVLVDGKESRFEIVEAK